MFKINFWRLTAHSTSFNGSVAIAFQFCIGNHVADIYLNGKLVALVSRVPEGAYVLCANGREYTLPLAALPFHKSA